MVTAKTEVRTAAERMLDFFRKAYPQELAGKERKSLVETLSEKVDELSWWIEARKYDQLVEEAGGNFYGERWRAKRLRELYEEENVEKIAEYGRKNINTMTGGWGEGVEISYGHSPFHNETTLNHLKYFDSNYSSGPYSDYIRESHELAPFYQSLVEEAKDIKSRALKIREEICADEDFKQRGDKTLVDHGDWKAVTRELYLLEEFRRREQVIPLLRRVEKLCSSTIDLTKTVIELSRRPAF